MLILTNERVILEEDLQVQLCSLSEEIKIFGLALFYLQINPKT